MASRKPSTLHQVQIYFVGANCFVVPSNYRARNGLWVECMPVIQLTKPNADALAVALEQAQSASGIESPQSVSWDGQKGRVWKNAAGYWTVRWLADNTISIAPQKSVPLKTDAETGEVRDGGWKPDRDRQQIVPGDTPLRVIAEIALAGQES